MYFLLLFQLVRSFTRLIIIRKMQQESIQWRQYASHKSQRRRAEYLVGLAAWEQVHWYSVT